VDVPGARCHGYTKYTYMQDAGRLVLGQCFRGARLNAKSSKDQDPIPQSRDRLLEKNQTSKASRMSKRKTKRKIGGEAETGLSAEIQRNPTIEF